MLGRERGDTLIEVLFAFSVFSLVAVGALTLMNQGSLLSERALETSLVRQAVNGQAETLRFLHDSYVASYTPGQTFDPNASVKTPAWQWQAMVASIQQTGATTTTNLGGDATGCPTPATGSFIMDSQKGQFVAPANMIYQPASTYAQVAYNNGPKPQGMWIEAIRVTKPSNPSYIDFHILACWPSPSGNIPVTLGTVVRLYEPN